MLIPSAGPQLCQVYGRARFHSHPTYVDRCIRELNREMGGKVNGRGADNAVGSLSKKELRGN